MTFHLIPLPEEAIIFGGYDGDREALVERE